MGKLLYKEKFSAATPQQEWERDAKGKNITIFGGTNGIGLALAKLFAGAGADVTIVGRNNRAEGIPNITFLRADLQTMAAAKNVSMALDTKKLDVLIFTTGILAPPFRVETEERLTQDMVISALSRLAILDDIAPKLRPKTRIFIMGLPGGNKMPADWTDLNAERVYRRSRQLNATIAVNEAIVLDFAQRYKNYPLMVFGLNSSLVLTDIRKGKGAAQVLNFSCLESLRRSMFCVSPEQYAQTMAPVMLAPALDGETGFHFNEKGQPIKPSNKLTQQNVVSIMQASRALVYRGLGY